MNAAIVRIVNFRHSSTPNLVAFGVMVAAAILILGWFANPIGYVPDDAYFYLVIAKNIVVNGQQSFSTIIPTNGFQPFWQYLLVLYSWPIAQLDPSLLDNLRFALPLSTAVTAIGAYFLFRAAKAARCNVGVGLGGPLFYVTILGVLYSEAHLTFAMLGIFLWAGLRNSTNTRRYYLFMGIAAAGLFLARLDSVFIVAAWFGITAVRSRKDLRTFLTWSVLPFLVITGPYIASNELFFGSPVPVSGALKSTFPHVAPLSTFVSKSGLAISIRGYSVIFGLLPIAVSLLIRIYFYLRREPVQIVFDSLLLGVIVHALSVMLFTNGGTEWFWYWVPSVTIGAMSVARIPFIRTLSFERIYWAAPLAVVLGLMVVFVLTTTQARNLDDSSPAALMFKAVDESGVDDGVILVSDFPGAFAYFRPKLRVYAADMLTGNQRVLDEYASSGRPFDVFADKVIESGFTEFHILNVGGSFLAVQKDPYCLGLKDLRHPMSITPLISFGPPDYRDHRPPLRTVELWVGVDAASETWQVCGGNVD